MVLFVAFLIENDIKSSTIKSYLSAIRAILWENDIKLNEDMVLLGSLTRACKLKNDVIEARLPITNKLLSVLIKKCSEFFSDQPYLKTPYKALLSTAYFGLFRVGEVTDGPHVLLAHNVSIGQNKKKMLFVLKTSKTTGLGDKPQRIKIKSNPAAAEDLGEDKKHLHFCPFEILEEYIAIRPDMRNRQEQFFMFRDNSPVQAHHLRTVLKELIKMAGLRPELYSGHSLRIGRASQLAKLGVSVETIKKLGRWRSNAVFRYLRD